MSFFAGFAGAGAQAYDQSLKQWRQLFQEQEQFDAQMDMREQELEVTKDRYDWEKEFNQMQLDFQEKEFDANRLSNWYDNAMAAWPNMTSGERLALVENFNQMDTSYNPNLMSGYSTLLQSQVRDTMSPQAAKGYLANIFNQPLGTRVPEWLANEALRVLADDPEYDSIKAQVDAFVGGNAEEWEQVRNNEWTQAQLETDRARVDIANVAGDTDLAAAQAASIYQDMEIDAELRPVILAQETSRRDILQNQAVQEGIRAGRLDEQITASLSETYASIRGMDNEDELFNATFEDVVSQISSEAGISAANASYLVATETARIALANGDVERMLATVDQIRMQTEAIEADIELTGVRMESEKLAMTEARVRIAQDLVANGDVELLNAVAPDLLGTVVGEDAAAALTADLAEIAQSNRSDEQKLYDTNLRVSMAQAEYEERTLEDRVSAVASSAEYAAWEVATAEEDRLLRNNLAERGMRVDEGHLALLRDRYTLDATQVQNPPPVDPAARTEVINSTRLALGQDPGEIRQIWTDYKQAEADLLLVQGALEAGLSPDQLQALAIRYQVPQGGIEGISPAVLEDYISTRATQLRNSAIGGATAFITTGLNSGVLFEENELGFPSDLYDAAIAPLNAVMDPDSTPEWEDAVTYFRRVADAREGNPIDITGAGYTWQEAEEAGLRPALESRGISSPSDLMNAINGTVEEYNQSSEVYNELAGWYTNLTGSEPSYQTAEGLSELTTWGSRLLAGLRTAQTEAADLGPNAALGGAARRQAATVLTNLSEATGLSIEQLENLGVVSNSIFGDPYISDPRQIANVLSYAENMINSGITAANTLFNW